MTTQRIKVVQMVFGDWDTPEGWFARYVEPLNRQYCDAHGYQYVVDRTPWCHSDRHPNWHAVDVMQRNLEDCDYLVYVDADAVFYTHQIALHEEILPLMEPNHVICLSNDCLAEHYRWEPHGINTGVVILKNGDDTRNILKQWHDLTEPEPCRNPEWFVSGSQKAFYDCFLSKYRSKIQVIMNYYRLQGLYSYLLRHVSKYSDTTRHEFFKSIYDSHEKRHCLRQTEKKIKVVQMVYGECLQPGNWFDDVQRINQLYCDIHGYEYIPDRRATVRPDRHGNWMKVDTIMDNLHDCDYLVSLEGDCAFYCHSLSLENEMIPLLPPHKSVLTTSATGGETSWRCSHGGVMVMLFKNNEFSREVVQFWDSVTKTIDGAIHRYQHPFDEMGFRQLVYPQYAQHIHVEKDYYRIQSPHGQFIQHMHSHFKRNNPECFRQIWESPMMRRNELLLDQQQCSDSSAARENTNPDHRRH